MTVDSTIPPYVLRLDIPGADASQIAAGLAAARTVFERANVEAEQAYDAYVARETWRRTGGVQLTQVQIQHAALFAVAQLAAFTRALGTDADCPQEARLFVGLMLD